MLTIRPPHDNELESAFSLVKQLRSHLTYEKYVELLDIMKPRGYQILCLLDGDKIVSCAGFAQLTNLYYGEHIWVYELITDENHRGKGYGKMLLAHIEKYAAENSLTCVALSSRLDKEDAHRFYENHMDYEKVSYVFKKMI